MNRQGISGTQGGYSAEDFSSRRFYNCTQWQVNVDFVTLLRLFVQWEGISGNVDNVKMNSSLTMS